MTYDARTGTYRQPEHVDAEVYAIVVPQFARNRDPQGRAILEGAKVDAIRQTRPTSLPRGGIVTRLTLRIDAAALLPPSPEAVIHVHAGEVDLIEVEASDPRDPDEE